ncbi:PREDICTED: actin-like protein 10 [Leptosomus discolor]|uniref:actin-like protein 10 n=1 Tax=Leptosomus discolor TaxID=188344 RepID=UPI000522CA1F|nr:PREDICTED: actin-like protein 10 [Leptosomus discolor]
MPKPAVVIDNGSSFTRAGFAGQKKPKFVLRTAWLHPCSAGTTWETQRHPTAAESTAGCTVAPRTYPLKHGIIEDWDSMENLWSHLFFCGLKALPEEQPVLMANSPSCPSTNREKVAEVLFESFGVPALHMANTGFLSLCAYGRVTGLAVEAGAGVSHVTPVCQGQTWREATYRLEVAGGFLSSYLHSLLMESPNDPSALQALKKPTVIQLKKQCCYVSMDYKGDLRDQGLPDLVWQSLQKVPDHARRDTVGNIVLSGGSSMFPGFPERMCLELNTLFRSTDCQIQVLASPERGTAAWVGGSMAASLSSFQQAWTTKGEYQEHGAHYVHRAELEESASEETAAETCHGSTPGTLAHRAHEGMCGGGNP